MDAVFEHEKAAIASRPQELHALGKYLLASGYHYTAVTPATHEVNLQRNPGRHASDLRGILGWSLPFTREAVSEQEFRLMAAAGILDREGDLWRSTLRWSSLGGLLCAHSAYPTDSNDAVFFGPDTYRFARFVESWLASTDREVARAADIGCGSGAGALLVAKARPESQVLAVDINPLALQLTAVNARLAQTPNVLAQRSDLLNDTEGEFDLIISNPPYMLDSQERAYRHGGGELGAGLSHQIVETALTRLSPGGTLLLYTGVAITDGQDPFLNALTRRLQDSGHSWHYQELDPDVFGDELTKPAYVNVERIAAVGLELTLGPA